MFDPSTPCILNYDYKTLTSILANKIKTTISKYIAPDQAGFIPGRSAATNIRKMLNLIKYAKASKTKSVFLFYMLKKLLIG